MTSSVATPAYSVSEALVKDAPLIQELILYWSKRTPVLEKSLGQIYENLREFVVVRDGDRLAGAAAMHIDWGDLAEIRSVVVHPDYKGKGVGRLLIDKQISVAKHLGIDRVFVLTDQVGFFGHMGFEEIDKGDLPHKVWRDCMNCPIFLNCTEVAMARWVNPPLP
ncbi:MAG: N-acetyltransferase [Candidatus Sumerlaeia bacterium]|nr:N-acetyltransferase [Candidatus Sumerlaeia bacterium]